MLAQQINPSPCILRLEDDGYHVTLSDGAIVISDIPCLGSDGSIGVCFIHAPLPLINGVDVGPPSDHTVVMVGEYPCRMDGKPNTALVIGENPIVFKGESYSGHYLSQKPMEGGVFRSYKDWYEKMTVYIRLISGPAVSREPSLSANIGHIPLTNPSEDVFCYPNNASSKNGTSHLALLMAHMKVGIIGLGGTGSYVLDLISKTRLLEIHLFDDDVLETHNAFRSSGAVPIKMLRKSPKKVNYYAMEYGNLRRGISPHDFRVDNENMSLLDGLDFVFLCVDVSPAKVEIIAGLLERKIPFVDTGIGAQLVNNELSGIIRTTLVADSFPEVALRSVVTEVSDENLYATNIQIAELNSINAALAVMKFKTHFGFYKKRPDDSPNWIMPIGRQIPIGMVEHGRDAKETYDIAS